MEETKAQAKVHGVRTYRYGPFVVSTEFCLRTLPAEQGQAGSSCIAIAHGAGHSDAGNAWLHEWIDACETTLALSKDGERYWLRVPDQADFLLDPACGQVACSPLASDLDEATLEHLLVDQILPRYLAHLGHVALHAAMLQVDGHCILISAPSGWGKSTLSGLLAARGHTLLSDDCTLLGMDSDRVYATATYPSLRLWPDSVKALYPNGVRSQAMASYSDKQRVPSAVSQPDALQVDALIMLGDPNDETTMNPQFSPIRAVDTCLSLVRHSFQLDPSDKPRMATHLRTCSQIARQLPSWRFDYRRDYAQADAVVAALEAHVASLPPSSNRT